MTAVGEMPEASRVSDVEKSVRLSIGCGSSKPNPCALIGGFDRLRIASFIAMPRRRALASLERLSRRSQRLSDVIGPALLFKMKLVAVSLLFEENSLFRRNSPLFAFQNSLFR
jgi:hypothetical protein